MLALHRLKLSHFRSYISALIEPEAPMVALYGANGAGKTNILEAVSLLSPGRGLRRAPPADLARRPESIGWKITAELESLSEQHEIATWSEGDTGRIVEIDGKKAPQTALGQLARVVWLVPVMDRLWVEGTAGRRGFLDRMVLSFHPDHAQATLTYEKAMRERNRLLKDQVHDAAWFDALEGQMADAGARISANRSDVLQRLQAAQNNAATAFPAADLTLIGAELETVGDLRHALGAGRDKDRLAGRTLDGPHRVDLHAVYRAKGVEARACSTGEQKALLISLILANARALREDFGAPPILLLDEVTAHLDATRRAALFDEIDHLGAQAWMTGTGPELFDTLGNRAQFIEVTDQNGRSQIS